MKPKPGSRKRRSSTKSILRLPGLEHAKAAVLNSLTSSDARRGYRHAIDECADGYRAVGWQRVSIVAAAHRPPTDVDNRHYRSGPARRR